MIENDPEVRVAGLARMPVPSVEDFNEVCVAEYNFAVVWAAHHLDSVASRRQFVDTYVQRVERELTRLHPDLSARRRSNLTLKPLRGLNRSRRWRQLTVGLVGPARNVVCGLSSVLSRIRSWIGSGTTS